MTQEDKDKIVKMGKSFAKGFRSTIPSINNSGWLIVDPFSAYLSACGYPNELGELPPTKTRPQVLIMKFSDGSQLIPAGKDLELDIPGSKNWQWL